MPAQDAATPSSGRLERCTTRPVLLVRHSASCPDVAGFGNRLGAMTELDADRRPATTRALLAKLGAAMIAAGQPVHEVQDELTGVSAHLGHRDIQIGAGPTSITVALRSGAPATFELITTRLRLDQAADVRRIRYELLTGVVDRDGALSQLAALPGRPPRYPTWLQHIGSVAVAVGIALILQPGRANVLAAALCAVLVIGLGWGSERSRLLRTLLPTVAAFAVACIVFSAAQAGLLDGPLRTVLPPLAALLPGALIVNGMSELAAGHMQAGSSRLIYGMVQLGLFALGLVAAVALLDVGPAQLANLRIDDLGWWAPPAGLALIGVGICLMEGVVLRLLPWVLLVLTLAGAAQGVGHHLGPPALGSFFGAIAASMGAMLVEALRPQLPRLMVFLPAFWLLVPGSLGLLGATQLVVDPGQALEVGMGMAVIICAIALGLLVGTTAAGSLGGVVRQLWNGPRGRKPRP